MDETMDENNKHRNNGNSDSEISAFTEGSLIIIEDRSSEIIAQIETDPRRIKSTSPPPPLPPPYTENDNSKDDVPELKQISNTISNNSGNRSIASPSSSIPSSPTSPSKTKSLLETVKHPIKAGKRFLGKKPNDMIEVSIKDPTKILHHNVTTNLFVSEIAQVYATHDASKLKIIQDGYDVLVLLEGQGVVRRFIIKTPSLNPNESDESFTHNEPSNFYDKILKHMHK